MEPQAEANRSPSDKPSRWRRLWRIREEIEARSYIDSEILHVRAVEFIAKAGLSSPLRNAIDGPVLKLLSGQTGFGGAMVLTPHKEPRRILVLSFWETERACREYEWERTKEVRKQVEPLVDAFLRVQTYGADLSQPLLTGQSVDAAQPC